MGAHRSAHFERGDRQGSSSAVVEAPAREAGGAAVAVAARDAPEHHFLQGLQGPRLSRRRQHRLFARLRPQPHFLAAQPRRGRWRRCGVCGRSGGGVAIDPGGAGGSGWTRRRRIRRWAWRRQQRLRGVEHRHGARPQSADRRGRESAGEIHRRRREDRRRGVHRQRRLWGGGRDVRQCRERRLRGRPRREQEHGDELGRQGRAHCRRRWPGLRSRRHGHCRDGRIGRRCHVRERHRRRSRRAR